MRRTRRAPAEFVRAFQLLEELHGVVDAIHAELKRVTFQALSETEGFAARAEGAHRAEREIRLVFGLAEAGRRQHQQHEDAQQPS